MNLLTLAVHYITTLYIHDCIYCFLYMLYSPHFPYIMVYTYVKCYRPISQTVFMLSIAINRAEHVCATVIIKHNYMLMCNHKIVINIMLCL